MAIIAARLMATKVFPSPGIVEVTAIDLKPSSASKNSKLLRTPLNDSDIPLFGRLVTTMEDIGSFSAYRWITPSNDVSVWEVTSSMFMISLCVIYRMTTKIRERIAPTARPTKRMKLSFGETCSSAILGFSRTI